MGNPILNYISFETRNEIIIDLRKRGMTFENISEIMGISKQRVHEIVKNSSRRKGITSDTCIYSQIRHYLNDNHLTISKFATLCLGDDRKDREKIARALKGGNCKKDIIDAILRVTGFTYEVAFKK